MKRIVLVLLLLSVTAACVQSGIQAAVQSQPPVREAALQTAPKTHIPADEVALMPFDDIRAHIRDDLRFSYAWTDEGNNGITELHIKRIVLSCAIERIPNDPDEAALVPAWVVVYNDNRSEITKQHDKIMLINAINGSYLHTI